MTEGTFAPAIRLDRLGPGAVSLPRALSPMERSESMASRTVVLAFFDNEAEADDVVEQMKAWDAWEDEVKLNAIGVLALDDKGKLKTHKLGKRSVGKGAGIGLVLAVIAPPTLLAGVIGGGFLGAFHHKGLGLKAEDRRPQRRHMAPTGQARGRSGLVRPEALYRLHEGRGRRIGIRRSIRPRTIGPERSGADPAGSTAALCSKGDLSGVGTQPGPGSGDSLAVTSRRRFGGGGNTRAAVGRP